MGQLVGCIRGIAAACRALDMPIVSGNVSLYNETEGRAILPTPTIGAVGLLDDLGRADPHGACATATCWCSSARPAATSASPRSSPSSSAARKATPRRSTSPPSGRRASSCAGPRPRGWSPPPTTSPTAAWRWRPPRWRWPGRSGSRSSPTTRLDAAGWFFGEDQGRYLVACPAEKVDHLLALAVEARVPARVTGQAGGDRVALGASAVALAELAEAHGQGLARLLD